MGNILVTDIHENPERDAAPYAYKKETNKEINEVTKKMIQEENPTIKSIDDRLFKDLGDNYMFEESMSRFHTMPNTKIPNDQEGFADFCYGTMTSCKEGNEFACTKKNTRYNNY
jgi:hypothetical protein